MFERLNRMIEWNEFQKIQQLKVLLIGIGGVGGYTLECFVRSGILNITVCDYDVIEKSNLNRQIISTNLNLGHFKVEEAKKRVLLINPDCNIQVISEPISESNFSEILTKEYDFVVDACDDVGVKKACIISCLEQGIPVISCMGTGNRFHPEKLEIISLERTINDPLAKKIRNQLRKVDQKYLKVPVVSSRELPIHTLKLGTICQVPMAAGSLLASFVINEAIKNK